VSGHDLSVLPEMTLSLPKGNRGLRSRAAKARQRIHTSLPQACAQASDGAHNNFHCHHGRRMLPM
jgi:hypothetical protein